MTKARDIADNAGQGGSGGGSNKNLIINGGFQIFQRATAATTAVNDTYQTADRWKIYESTDGAYTTERSTDTPSGTGYSLKAIVTTADTSIAATQSASIDHYIEAQNLQQLQYGTSSAKTLTLSFFVKSNKTGIYTIGLYKPDTTGYMFTKEYTINSADTWEKKTITITSTAGSTSFITSSGGVIANDNGIGLGLSFNLVRGSNFNGGTSDAWSATIANYSTTNAVNWMDTVGNTFLISEVQLEVGDKATDFEHTSFGDEFARCQRYFTKSGSIGTAEEWYAGVATYSAFGPRNAINLKSTNDRAWVTEQFPVHMRAIPTVTFYPARAAISQTAGSISQYNANTAVTTSTKPLASTQNLYAYFLGTSSDNSSGYTYQYYAEAEL